MMPLANLIQAFFSRNYYQYTVFTSETLTSALSKIGASWLILNVFLYFSNIPAAQVKAHGSWFIGFIALWTLWDRRPLLSITERLLGRDIELEVKIGNIFTESGAKVISINTTFDTDIEGGIIAEDSLQGKFTKKYYESVQSLDNDLETALAGYEVYEDLQNKSFGKKKRYKMGTTVKLRPKRQLFYLVAIAELNEQGVAQSSFEEIKSCLKKAWEYIGECGETEPIVVPLVGSGRARITETRNVLAREIIRSFVEACATRKCCEKLTLVISPYDYRKHKLNLYELGEYLRFVCRYTDLDKLKQGVEENSQKNPLGGVSRA